MRARLITIGAAAAAAYLPAAVAHAAARPLTICGAEHAAAVVADGASLAVAGAATVDRCAAGAWRRATTTRRRARLTLATGDYRIRARGQRARYARVGAGEIVHMPVRFAVVNRNDSKSPCPADGKAYAVVGTLVGPRAELGAGAITVFMHGLSYGKWLFGFDAVAGYDFQTEMARLGHVSLAYDLLGYGASDKPANGLLSCFGSDAAVAHQVVERLRADGFRRIALAGHQGAGASAQEEAYSFHDVDAVALIGFADRAVTTAAALAFAQTGASCAMAPSGYAYYADFASQLHDAEPAVVSAATKLRSLDPCGRALGAALSLVADTAFAATIDVPVLLAYGREDALFNDGPIGTTAQQRDLYGASPDVSLMYWDDTGTAFTLGRSAPEVRRRLSGWLSAHGF